MVRNKLLKDQFYKDAVFFLDKIHRLCEQNKINITSWPIDHICYRVASAESYRKNQQILTVLGELLIESEVNGRPISTYKLNEPIKYKTNNISIVELPFPKKNKPYNEGFEHIELIITESFQNIIDTHSHLEFDSSSLSKKYNKELKLKLGESQIKLHHQSLEDVIKYEIKNNLVVN